MEPMKSQPLTPDQRRRIGQDVVGLAGFLLMVGGIAAIDWRAGLIAAGVWLQVAAFAGMCLARRQRPSP